MKLEVLGFIPFFGNFPSSVPGSGIVYFPDGTYYSDVPYNDYRNLIEIMEPNPGKRPSLWQSGFAILKGQGRVPHFEEEYKAYLKNKYGSGNTTTKGGHVSTTYTDPTGSGNSNEPNVPFVPEQKSSGIGKMVLMGLGLFAIHKMTKPKKGNKGKGKSGR